MSGEKGSGERQARPAAWPEAGVLGSPATRGAGDRDRAGGAGLRGPCRVARSSRPRPLLLELPPPNLGSEKLSESLLFPPAPPGGADAGGSSGRSCGSAASGRGGHGVCGARGVSAGCVRGERGVCGMDVESAGCARYEVWLPSLPGEWGGCWVSAGSAGWMQGE